MALEAVVCKAAVDMWTGPRWSVAIKDLPDGTLAQFVSALRVEPNASKASKTPFRARQFINLSAQHDGRLSMPPAFARAVLPNARIVANTHVMGDAMVDIRFAGTLREEPPQVAAYAAYFEWLRENPHAPGAVICLPCGYGKTALALALLAALGRVALVLVHTNALLEQWIEEARAFLPAAKIGYVKAAGVVRVEGVDVIVASIASLLVALDAPETPSWVPVLLARAGTLVLDEAHHAVAATIWRVFSSVPAQFRIALTATPRRGDGLTSELLWVTGPIVFQASRTVAEIHVVHMAYAGAGHGEIMRRGQLDMAAMVNALCEDEVRSAMAVALIRHLVVTQGRRVLVVTPRVEHVHALAASLEDALGPRASALEDALGKALGPRIVHLFKETPFKMRCGKHVTPKDKEAARQAWDDSGPHGSMEPFDAPVVSKVLTGMTPFARTLAYQACVVVATDTMLKEGVSVKALDTLVDLGNSGDCEQVVGRILRTCPDKRVPLVVDFYMRHSAFAGLHAKRSRFYTQQQCKQHFVVAGTPEDLLRGVAWEAFHKPWDM